MIENIAAAYQAATLSGTPEQYRAFIGHKKEVVKTTLWAVPVSLSRTKETITKLSTGQSLGLTALTGVNTAYFYGDDIAGVGIYRNIRESLGNPSVLKEVASISAIGLLHAGSAAMLTKLNQKYPVHGIRVPIKNHESLSEGEPAVENNSIRERFVKKYETIKYHLGRFGISLSSGVPLGSLQQELTDREKKFHIAGYSAIGAGIAFGLNAGIEAFNDSALTATILVGGIAARNYIGTACDQAATSGAENANFANNAPGL